MKAIKRALIIMAILGITFGFAYAHFAKPEDAVKYRKSVMFLTAQHFKRMGAVVQGKVPYDKAAFAENAETFKMLASLPWQAMLEPGTDKGDTTMSGAVFSKQAKFKQAAEAFEKGAEKLAQLAAAGDLKGSKSQFGMLAGSCKSCHNQFRK